MHKDNIGNVLGGQSYICQLKGVQLHTGGKYFESFLIKFLTFFPCNVLTSYLKKFSVFGIDYLQFLCCDWQ